MQILFGLYHLCLDKKYLSGLKHFTHGQVSSILDLCWHSGVLGGVACGCFHASRPNPLDDCVKHPIRVSHMKRLLTRVKKLSGQKNYRVKKRLQRICAQGHLSIGKSTILEATGLQNRLGPSLRLGSIFAQNASKHKEIKGFP